MISLFSSCEEKLLRVKQVFTRLKNEVYRLSCLAPGSPRQAEKKPVITMLNESM